MPYLDDFPPSSVIRKRFNTHQSNGTPITLAGSPTCAVYKTGTTESTAGVTLTVDLDGRTGLHSVEVNTAADTSFYAAGDDYDIVITQGTVDGIDVSGTVIGTFSLSNRTTFGQGTVTFTYTVYKADGTTPLEGCEVRVSSDIAGLYRSEPEITDSLGRVTFRLAAGTYYFWRYHPGWNFSDPDTETVS